MSKDAGSELAAEHGINVALRFKNERNLGCMDAAFLGRSIGTLNPPTPLCVREETRLCEVIDLLRAHKMGCILITDDKGRLAGIFSERDLTLKVDIDQAGITQQRVGEFMTVNPVTASFDMTIAYILNLMSQGGFRHIPIVDKDNLPVGMVSVKDIVDHMVSTFMDDLLNFELPPGFE